jgi:hypothetical protein
MDQVFGTGRVCSNCAHYLSESEDGSSIPADACPINCVVNDFLIYGLGDESLPDGVQPPRKDGNCVRFTIQFTIRVWYEYCSSETHGRDVKAASKTFMQELAVPLCSTGRQQLVLCEDDCSLTVKRVALRVVRAELTPKPEDFPADFPLYAIRVILEKDFFVMAVGKAVVCISSCGFSQENLPVFQEDCGGVQENPTEQAYSK